VCAGSQRSAGDIEAAACVFQVEAEEAKGVDVVRGEIEERREIAAAEGSEPANVDRVDLADPTQVLLQRDHGRVVALDVADWRGRVHRAELDGKLGGEGLLDQGRAAVVADRFLGYREELVCGCGDRAEAGAALAACWIVRQSAWPAGSTVTTSWPRRSRTRLWLRPITPRPMTAILT
jgi:hypothetical protein